MRRVRLRRREPAPELLGVNAPLEEGVTDVLKTVRSFFGDPNSKDPLEKQIKKKFDDADVDKSGALDKKEMKTLLRNTVNRGSERLSEHDMNNLIDILDADGSGSIEVEELLNAIKPRGSECPYDQEALKAVAGMVDKVLVLVDPQHTRFNPWERHMIQATLCVSLCVSVRLSVCLAVCVSCCLCLRAWLRVRH